MVRSTTRELSEGERAAVYHALCRKWDDCKQKLHHGAINVVATQFGLSRKTVSRYWARTQEAESPNEVSARIKSRKAGNVGRKRVDLSDLHENLKALPHRRRRNYRTAAFELNLAHSRCQTWRYLPCERQPSARPV